MAKKKVLVVDDAENIARLIKTRLELTGDYEVSILTDSREILHQVYVFNPDVLLLDLMMPHMGGLEISDMLNSDPIGREIPIIVISALDKDSDKFKAYKLGITDYLVKPIDSERLIAAVEKAIKSKSQ